MGQSAQGMNDSGVVLTDFFCDVSEGRELTDIACDPDEGMTRQEFQDECDINVLMSTYEKSGVIPRFNQGTPAFLDVSELPDLPRAIQIMADAETAFMTLPASVRREFDNSAVQFVEYASDPANIDQMRKWGLAPPKPAPAPSAAAAGESAVGDSTSPTGSAV